MKQIAASWCSSTWKPLHTIYELETGPKGISWRQFSGNKHCRRAQILLFHSHTADGGQVQHENTLMNLYHSLWSKLWWASHGVKLSCGVGRARWQGLIDGFLSYGLHSSTVSSRVGILMSHPGPLNINFKITSHALNTEAARWGGVVGYRVKGIFRAGKSCRMVHHLYKFLKSRAKSNAVFLRLLVVLVTFAMAVGGGCRIKCPRGTISLMSTNSAWDNFCASLSVHCFPVCFPSSRFHWLIWNGWTN